LAGFAGAFSGALTISAPGGYMIVASGITISANMAAWLVVNASGYAQFFTQTITISNTPAFSWQGVLVSRGVADMGGITFSGSATGTRYVAQHNGIINTGGGGASYLPGDAAGSTATQGQYL
jgi:hypothetical protein